MDEKDVIQSLIEEARATRDEVPDFEFLSPPEIQALVRVAHLEKEFMDKCQYAIGLEPLLAQAIGWTQEELSEERDLIGRWLTMRSELRATVRGISTAVLKRRYRVGLAFLQLYAIIEQLARNPAYSHLYAVLEELKQLNPTGRKRRRKAPEPQNDDGAGDVDPE